MLTELTSLKEPGHVLCMEDTHCFRAYDPPARDQLSSASKIYHPLLAESRHKVSAGSIKANSRHLATCSADHSIKLWSTANFEYNLEKTLTGHQRWVWDAAFSADSAYLVTGKVVAIS